MFREVIELVPDEYYNLRPYSSCGDLERAYSKPLLKVFALQIEVVSFAFAETKFYGLCDYLSHPCR